MKHHFIDLISDVKAIIGMNGLIWIYYSTVKMDTEYFNDDMNKINTLNKHETPNEIACINIILFKNIVKSLDNHKIRIDQTSMMKYYELYIQHIEAKISGNVSDLDYLKKHIAIDPQVDKEIITKVQSIVQSSKINYDNEIVNLNKIANEAMDVEDGEEDEEGGYA